MLYAWNGGNRPVGRRFMLKSGSPTDFPTLLPTATGKTQFYEPPVATLWYFFFQKEITQILLIAI